MLGVLLGEAGVKGISIARQWRGEGRAAVAFVFPTNRWKHQQSFFDDSNETHSGGSSGGSCCRSLADGLPTYQPTTQSSNPSLCFGSRDLACQCEPRFRGAWWDAMHTKPPQSKSKQSFDLAIDLLLLEHHFFFAGGGRSPLTCEPHFSRRSGGGFSFSRSTHD